MAPRAYWKGYLKLSLVSCPIALYPATSEREKISFNQLNKETGNRIRYRKVDAETGDDVEQSNIIKGYGPSRLTTPSHTDDVHVCINRAPLNAVGPTVPTTC
jgi:DNA end-binding protein Ku